MAIYTPQHAIAHLLPLLEREGQAAVFYPAFLDVVQALIGYRLITLFLIHQGQTLRIFSTDEPAYPVGVRKPMANSAWGQLVIGDKMPFLAQDRQAVRAAFFDHEKIESLGCGSAISVPIIYGGECLGALNLNHREYFYDAEHVADIKEIAPLLIPLLLDECRRADAAT